MKTIEPKKSVLPFDQQQRESNIAFAAFNIYLSLGTERSARRVAEKMGRSTHSVNLWASRQRWAERLAAYNAHLALVEREATEATLRGKAAVWATREQNLRETEWAMHERAIAAAKRGLDAYMDREKVYANLTDIARMLEIASKLGRLATGLGDGTQRKADDLPAVRVEVSVALEKIYGQTTSGLNSPPEAAAKPAIVDVEEVKP